MELKDAINKAKKHLCRGEITVLDKNNNSLSQTHYEYFTISFAGDFIMIQEYDINKNVITLNHTTVDINKIIDYKIDETSFTLNGKLSNDVFITLLIVFKERI